MSSTRGYKTFIMLNSTEHEIAAAHKTKLQKNEDICFTPLRYCVCHANKCLFVGILTFMSRINFVLS